MPEVLDTSVESAAANEFIETEQNYVQRLMTAYKIYWLGARSFLVESEHTKIFSNLEEIVLGNDNFLQDLLSLKSNKQADRTLADIFLHHIPKFSVYIVYCRGQQAAVQFLQEKLADPIFGPFINNCAATPECQGLDLGSFLLEPIQRLARYPLLLKHIQKYTAPDSNENSVLALAIAESEQLLSRANAAMAQAENEIKIINIQRRLSQINSHSRSALSLDFSQLIEPRSNSKSLPVDFTGLTRALDERRLLKNGIWIKLKSRRKIIAFLFSDFLLLAEAANGHTTLAAIEDNTIKLKRYREPIPVDHIWMIKEGPPALCPPGINDSNDYRILELEAQCQDTLFVHIPAGEFEDWCTAIGNAKRALKQQSQPTPESVTNGTGTMRVTIVSASNLMLRQNMETYCKVTLENTDQTMVTEKCSSASPHWNQTFSLTIPQHACNLKIEILEFESSHTKESLGEFIISSDFFQDFTSNETIPLQSILKGNTEATILIRLNYSQSNK